MSSLIEALMLILATGSCLGLLMRLLKLPAITGYIVAGIILGVGARNGVFPIADFRIMQTLSELGILFLMFSIGLEFGFRKLRALGLLPVIIGVVGTLGMWMIGTQAARLMGLSAAPALFAGATLAIASTTATLKTLDEMNLKSTMFGEKVVGVLLVEDLVAIVMIVILPSFAGPVFPGIELIRILGTLGASILLWWVIGFVAAPKLVRAARQYAGDEILLLLCVAVCLILAVFFLNLRSSAALGAFVAGSILADTREIRRIESLVKPLRFLFSAVFFVSFGMLVDVKDFVIHWRVIFFYFVVLTGGKFLWHFILQIFFGTKPTDAGRAAAAVANCGEFSFVLVQLGLALKVVEPAAFPIVAGVSILSFFALPYVLHIGGLIGLKLETSMPRVVLQFLASWSEYIRSISLSSSQIFRSLHSGFIRRAPQVLQNFKKMVVENYTHAAREATVITLGRLAPWNEYLVELPVDSQSSVIGSSLFELGVRERFNINIVAVERDSGTFASPDADLRLFPNDRLLIYGVESDIIAFGELCKQNLSNLVPSPGLHECELGAISIHKKHPFVGKSLRGLAFRKNYSCTVLALLRAGERHKNPSSDMLLIDGDILYVVGPRSALASISAL